MTAPPETVARAEGVLGEVVLRRRTNPAGYELIVGGVFLMDTAASSTEELLAASVLDRHDAPRRILLGGLGLGVTLGALLADARVERVDVVEIEPLLVEWLRSGLVPGADAWLRDPRVRVVIGDVRAAIRDAAPATYDGVVLDVDNGPDFLVHPQNAAVYERPALAGAAGLLAPGGMLAVWSAAPSATLPAVLGHVLGGCDEVVRTVHRMGRELTYHLYLARRSQ